MSARIAKQETASTAKQHPGFLGDFVPYVASRIPGSGGIASVSCTTDEYFCGFHGDRLPDDLGNCTVEIGPSLKTFDRLRQRLPYKCTPRTRLKKNLSWFVVKPGDEGGPLPGQEYSETHELWAYIMVSGPRGAPLGYMVLCLTASAGSAEFSTISARHRKAGAVDATLTAEVCEHKIIALRNKPAVAKLLGHVGAILMSWALGHMRAHLPEHSVLESVVQGDGEWQLATRYWTPGDHMYDAYWDFLRGLIGPGEPPWWRNVVVKQVENLLE